MVALFSATLFLSALLLFVLEPMVGKLALPLLGGAPAVWGTCVMFFQFELLAGYLYAHLSATRLPTRAQVALHLLLLAVGVLLLPPELRGAPAVAAAEQPVRTALTLLWRAVGIPMLAVSATAPLLQRWLSTTDDRAARDPFFLYAASNLGSLVALLAYPFVIEPGLGLRVQRQVWSGAYGALLLLTAVCGWQAVRSAQVPTAATTGAAAGVDWWRRMAWIALAFVPSTLMLSATTFISTDVAAIPMLWILPLGLYLLTYVLAFAQRPLLPLQWATRLLPVALALAMYSVIRPTELGLKWEVPIHLVALFLASYVCHAQLARSRPTPAHLTEYYLWISFGGLLGGVFNTLVAPFVFVRLSEYPIGLIAAALLRVSVDDARAAPPAKDLALALLPVAVALAIVRVPLPAELTVASFAIERPALLTAIPLLVCLLLSWRPGGFAIALGVVSTLLLQRPLYAERVLHEERSFFGTHRVFQLDDRHILTHGTTTHGAQSNRPDRQCTPLTYYMPSGPIGQIFESFTGSFAKAEIGSVGLGVASLAPYAQPGQHWTFFEINPAVERIAGNAQFFTFLTNCMRAPFDVMTGDARLQLAQQPDGRFDLLVLDAFSSDAIPLHLLTREALELYVQKLTPHGLLAFHISNRNLDLEPPIGNLARDLGLVAGIEWDVRRTPEEEEAGKYTSIWVIMARRFEDFGPIGEDSRWRHLATTQQAVWTDDYSNVISVLRGLDWGGRVR